MEGQEYIIKAEPLISKDEYNLIQTIIHKREKVKPGQKLHKFAYLLSNLVFTTEGLKLYGHAGKYYGSDKMHKYIRTYLIEDALVEHLNTQRDYYIKQVFEKRDQKNYEEIELKEELLRHEKAIIKLEGKTKILIEMRLEGDITKEVFKTKKSAIEEQKTFHNYEKMNVENKLNYQTMYNFYTVYILLQLTELDNIQSFNEKRKLVLSCIDKIVWDVEGQDIVEITIRPKDINVADFDVLVGEFRQMIKKFKDKSVNDLVEYTKRFLKDKKVSSKNPTDFQKFLR